MGPANAWGPWASATLTLMAFVLRIADLDSDSLWFDTAHSGVIALNPTLAEVVRAAASDFQAPLYFALLHYWLAGGPSDFWLRVFSALLGAAIVPLAYVLGRRLFSPGAGLLAALFCAITSYQVYYSRYPRGYILLALLAVAAAYALIRALEGGGVRRWLVHGLLVVLALYTHPYAFFLLPPLWGFGLLRVWQARQLLRPFLLTSGLALTAYLPWLGVSWAQWGQVQAGADAWIRPVSRDSWKTLFDWLWFMTRTEYGPALDLLLRGGRYLLSGVMLLGLWWGRRDAGLWWAAAMTTVPAALAFLFSSLVTPLWDPRYLVVVSPFLALWLGGSICVLNRAVCSWLDARGPWATVLRPALPVGAALLLTAMALPPLASLYRDPAFHTTDLREAMAWVHQGYREGDSVLHLHYQSYLPALWYDRLSPGPAATGPHHAIPCVWASLPPDWCGAWPIREVYVNPELEPLAPALAATPRVWLLLLYDHNNAGDEERAQQQATATIVQPYRILERARFIGVLGYLVGQ